MTRAVVFDLDGTLVDSAPDIARALNRALGAHSLGAVTEDETRAIVGGGARVLVREAIALAGGDAVRPDPGRRDPARLGPTRLGPTRLGPTRLGPTRLGPTRLGPTRLGPTRLGPTRLDPTRLDPARLDEARLDEARLDAVLADYTAAYDADPVSATTVYADAREILAELRARGMRTGVCTNKRGGLARRVLQATGLGRHVEAVVGIDEVAAGKPDPGHLTAVLDRLDTPPAETVYVGDTATDALTADRVGVPYRHVAWGHPLDGRDVIEDFRPLLAAAAPHRTTVRST